MTPDTVMVPDLSVVIPVYGCAACLEALHARLSMTLTTAVDSFEVIYVDDRAPDNAWPILERLADGDPRIVALRLSRNFGQHAAITAGLAESRGRWVVVMDCDLQDPPELIPQLLAEARAGADIVLAQREGVYQSPWRLAANRLYYRFLSAVTGVPMTGEAGAFSIIARKVVDAFVRFRDIDRHYLFILRWLGFETRTIVYGRAERAAGHSSYTLRRLIIHALNGIFFQTTAFLHWVIYGGIGISLIGLLFGAYLVLSGLSGNRLPGWTSLIVVNLVLGGAIILSIGVVGLYVGKIFEQVKERPLYVIDRRHRAPRRAGKDARSELRADGQSPSLTARPVFRARHAIPAAVRRPPSSGDRP